MKDDGDLLRKALERLVLSLSAKEVRSNRIEMVEEALLLARVALGQKTMTDEEQAVFWTNMETLGIQLLIDSMDRQDLALYRANVTFSDDEDNSACVVITTHPILGPLLDKHVEQMVEKHHPDKPKPNFDVN